MSQNPLGDGAAHPLATCLGHLLSLTTLELEACCLTDDFLESRIVSSLKQTKLTELSIGWNDWSVPAVKTWLQSLDFRSLNRLSLMATNGVVPLFINAFRSFQDCRLHYLNLSHCNLSDDDVGLVISSLGQLTHLKKLIFKNNPNLKCAVVGDLLTRCQGYAIRIEELDFLGCCLSNSSAADGGHGCSEALRSFLSWSKSLHRLALSFRRGECDPCCISSLSNVWIDIFGNKAVVSQLTPHQFILTVSAL